MVFNNKERKTRDRAASLCAGVRGGREAIGCQIVAKLGLHSPSQLAVTIVFSLDIGLHALVFNFRLCPGIKSRVSIVLDRWSSYHRAWKLITCKHRGSLFDADLAVCIYLSQKETKMTIKRDLRSTLMPVKRIYTLYYVSNNY